MGSPLFVARECELEQLDGFLNKALAWQGGVCFVAGEAGSGKTALVTKFARRAQDRHSDLVAAIGQSDAHIGVGDPFLPFREVLGQLTGDVEAKLAQGSITEENAGRLRKLLGLSGQALVAVGPDLIGIFVPGAGLATRVGAFVAEKVGWLDKLEELTNRPREREALGSTGIEQSHILEQYTNVLKTLAAEQPLLLVLDDLQWADAASIGLLFRLGRRIGESRILLVGTYRPEEVALGRDDERHPLEKVLAEFKRYFGDIWVDLDRTEEAERQRFVDAFVDTEPNRLGEGFRQALYDHTDGHPLFTIELLRDMQERGDLVEDEQGRWVEGAVLDWGDLPERVEGVIEERIGRLEEELRKALTVGSVEGEDFTAEVVARVRESDARGLIHQLSGEVEKQHRLVRARGVQRLDPGGQRLSLYRFQHNLFQTYLYNDLDAVERAVLHEDVGTVLEALYGDRADEIAVQLARHFVEAGITEKAVHYLRRAGEQAAARFANEEAMVFFSRALAMLPQVDESTGWPEEDLLLRYQLHSGREDLYHIMGHREAQRRELTTLHRLAEVLGGASRRVEVSMCKARYAETVGDYPAAIEALATAAQAAKSAEELELEAGVVRDMGYILWRQGYFQESRVHLEKALNMARGVGLRRVEANTLQGLGVVYWRLGKADEARKHARQSVELARKIGDRNIEGSSLLTLGNIDLNQGNYESARAYYEESLRISQEIGDVRGEAMKLGNLGLIAQIAGDFPGGMERFDRVRSIFHDIDDRSSEARAWVHMGRNAALQGLYDSGRVYYEHALEMYREIADRQGEVFVLVTMGQLLNWIGDNERAAELCQEALCLVQETGVRSAEGAAWTILARIRTDRGKLGEATDAYNRGLEIRRELGEHNLVAESVAGLAGVALEQGDLARAQNRVEEVLTYLETGTLDGTEEPIRVYLICYQVLKASQDPRAQGILDTAHRLLQEQVAKISDEELRHSFLENVAAHREIIREFTSRQQLKSEGE